MRKLTTGQGEDCTTGCFLNHEYIEDHQKLITIDLSRQEESDPDPKAIQEIEFAEQFQNIDGVNADGRQTVFV